jgi:hypothetical protein
LANVPALVVQAIDPGNGVDEFEVAVDKGCPREPIAGEAETDELGIRVAGMGRGRRDGAVGSHFGGG